MDSLAIISRGTYYSEPGVGSSLSRIVRSSSRTATIRSLPTPFRQPTISARIVPPPPSRSRKHNCGVLSLESRRLAAILSTVASSPAS